MNIIDAYENKVLIQKEFTRTVYLARLTYRNVLMVERWTVRYHILHLTLVFNQEILSPGNWTRVTEKQLLERLAIHLW